MDKKIEIPEDLRVRAKRISEYLVNPVVSIDRLNLQDELILIERFATLTADLNEANNDYRELLIERDEALRENKRLQAQLVRHEAPVSDEEWGQREELEGNRLWRKGFDRIIEARANPDSMGHNMQAMTPNYDCAKPQKE